VKVDGTLLENFDHLRRLIFFKKPGDKVQLVIERDSETLEVEATLGSYE
jgi:S1-C subfamily serine protease